MAQRPELVTTGEAARALGVNIRTLQKWAKAGLLDPDHRTIGGHARWDVERVRRELRNPSKRDRFDDIR